MATIPGIHSLCDKCWRDTVPGKAGELPHRTTQLRPVACCACGEETTSGIYYVGQPRDYRCRGNHPMTDQEYEHLMLEWIWKAYEIGWHRLCEVHGMSPVAARQATSDALYRAIRMGELVYDVRPAEMPAAHGEAIHDEANHLPDPTPFFAVPPSSFDKPDPEAA